MTKKRTSVTLSDEALSLLKALAKRYGVSQSAILEIAIREKADIALKGTPYDPSSSGTTETQGTT